MDINNTLEKINESININSGLEKTGSFLNRIDWKKPLNWLGKGASKISGNVINKSSEKGLDLGVLSFKLLTLVLIFGFIYFAMKIGKKPIKIILIILLILLAISVLSSIFFSGRL